jgi:hypothetical protein
LFSVVKFVFNIIFFVIFISITPAQTKYFNYKENFSILKDLYSEISRQICDYLPNDIKSLKLIISGEQNGWIVENLLRENISKCLPELKYSITDTSLVLDINQDTKIFYYKVLNKEELFSRTIRCNLIIKFTNRVNIISRSIMKTFTDTLPLADIQFVDNNKIFVNKENLGENGIFDTLFQPVIILVSIGTLIYLFFSVRSN